MRIARAYITTFVLMSVLSFKYYSGNTKNGFPNEVLALSVKDFTGFVGSYPISMHLNIREQSNGNVNYTGYYYYNKVGTKIQLTGSWIMRPGAKTYIELNEIVSGNYTGSFSLLPTTYGDYSSLSGQWMGNGKTLQVKLTQIN